MSSTSWLWHRPERAAAWAFALGSAAGAASLGVLAMIAESWAFSPRVRLEALQFTGALAAELVVGGAIAGGLARSAISLGRGWANALLALTCLAATLLSASVIILDGASHPPFSPTVGLLLSVLLVPALVLSFGPVLRLARRVRWQATDRGPLDVSAAACAWAAMVALIGVVLAPGPYFLGTSALGLLAAAFGLYRSSALAGVEARATLRRGLRTGAMWVVLGGVVLVPARLFEQRTTRNPAVIAIHKSGLAGHCEVRGAGREGDVSLWLVDCGSVTGPMIGWDEREGIVLEREKLYARVPRLRPREGAEK